MRDQTIETNMEPRRLWKPGKKSDHFLGKIDKECYLLVVSVPWISQGRFNAECSNNSNGIIYDQKTGKREYQST